MFVSNNYKKEYVVSKDNCYKDMANNISIFVLVIVLLIYLYFYNRNRMMYINKGDNVTINDVIKVLGSVFFVVGTLCWLYFQIYSDDNFISSPLI